MNENNPLLRFHQDELKGLKTAEQYALDSCDKLQGLFTLIKDENPDWIDSPKEQPIPIATLLSIAEFLREGSCFDKLDHSLGEIDHLIEPIEIACSIPGSSGCARNAAGLKIPILGVTQAVNSAHKAVSMCCGLFENYFRNMVRKNISKWRDCNAYDNAEVLLKTHWKTVRQDLLPVAQYDLNLLRQSVETEHGLAVDLSRKSTMETGALASPDRLTTPESGALPKGAKTKIPPPSLESRLRTADREISTITAGSLYWGSASRVSKLLGCVVKTLANHRSLGVKDTKGDKRSGIHDEYCYWRKEGNKHPKYYLPWIKENVGHLSKTFPELKMDFIQNLPANLPGEG